MSRRSHKAVRYAPEYRTEARETLERRWGPRLSYEHGMAWMVNGERNHLEPFHRWLHFKQSFAPELVRQFLKSARAGGTGPMLDPFGGAGTLVIECGRSGISATAVEAMPSLAYLTNARMETEYVEVGATLNWESWRTAAESLTHPLHRAALMLAVGQQHQSDGSPLAKPAPLADLFEKSTRMMREDLVRPLSSMNLTYCGDARHLEAIEDESMGGILTSPPYLSRHDYERVLRPFERVLAFWEPSFREGNRIEQIAAHPAATQISNGAGRLHPAAAEAVEQLQAMEKGRLPAVVAAYFGDMGNVMESCRRVLIPGGVFWLVVGGSRFKDAYVPSDLILAEMAEALGLQVTEFRVARRVIDSGRKLGHLLNVSPRESILCMVKA